MNNINSFYLDCLYWPVLKGKLAERMLFSKHDAARVNLIGATVIVPPAGQYDREADQRLTPSEHIKAFGGRMRRAFGGRPFFIDASHLDNDAHRVPGFEHPLVELFERAKSAGARPSVCVHLGSSSAYRAAAARIVMANRERACGIKIRVADLETLTLRADLEELLDELGTEPSNCVLFLDAGSDLSGDSTEIASALADQINIFPRLQEWLQFVFQMGTFPSKDGLKAGQFGEFERLDWPIYEAMIGSQTLLRKPRFGDYGVDAPGHVGGGGRAVAKLHYSDLSKYYVEKGLITTKGAKLANIAPVAAKFIARNQYYGADFSRGDKRIRELATLINGTGHASTWRWAGLDHHVTLTMDALCNAFGFKILPKVLAETSRADERQLSLALDDVEN